MTTARLRSGRAPARPRRAGVLPVAAVVLASALACARGGASRSPATSPTPRGTPSGAPRLQDVGQPGGTVRSPQGEITLTIPEGALPSTVTITIQPITNPAPGGLGGGYRLGPEGTVFQVPVTITFRGSALVALDRQGIAYQDADGYWLRPQGQALDAGAGTLSVATTHFSDWALVVGPTALDLSGGFTVEHLLEIPVVVSGSATLTFAGSDAASSAYLLSGTVTMPSTIAVGATQCSPVAPDAPSEPLRTNVVDVVLAPPAIDWGMSGHWNLVCENGSGPFLLPVAFDTYGINDIGCARSYLDGPVIGPDRLYGRYLVNCGARGTVTGTWDFRSAACGTACVPQNDCDVGVAVCDTGVQVCTDTLAPVADGTPCALPGGGAGACAGGVCQ